MKVLLLPKFEVGGMADDFPGEAQCYYEQYLRGAAEFDVPASPCRLYDQDGVALCVLGMGKVNAALGTMAVLTDCMKKRSLRKNLIALGLVCLFVLLCGYNRMHMTNHFLSDVCFGVLNSTLLTAGIVQVFTKRRGAGLSA